jgi:hypothetical protein
VKFTGEGGEAVKREKEKEKEENASPQRTRWMRKRLESRGVGEAPSYSSAQCQPLTRHPGAGSALRAARG